MSRFFSEKFTDLEAYVPGEQPKEQQYIKLNTNENAFPPHPAVAEAAEQAARKLHLYPDTECTELRKTLAERLGLSPDELIMVNGSTGIALGREEIRKILEENPYNVVVVDEAYVDFGAESCIPLIREYDNLLVTQTFSKSRSLAGGRLGYGAANPEIIRDLNTIRNSTNPYNIDTMTQAAGTACLKNDEYNEKNCRTIIRTREKTAKELRKLGFEVTQSSANFLFARHPVISGEELYRKLKERRILIRHFSADRIKDYNRISIGTDEQMEAVVKETEKIINGR